jgi:arsenate reductase (thioredoxin)
MAEAIVNYRLGDTWEAFSAGVKAAGYIDPIALATLAEIGIQHIGRSKHLDEFADVDFDLVVTLCDDAAESYTIWLSNDMRVHHSITDPTIANNMNDFRNVRDEIKREIITMLVNH